MIIEIDSFVVLIVAVAYAFKTAYSIYQQDMPTMTQAAILYIEVLVLVVVIGALSIGIPIHIG